MAASSYEKLLQKCNKNLKLYSKQMIGRWKINILCISWCPVQQVNYLDSADQAK
jgi:hypothetical protein